MHASHNRTGALDRSAFYPHPATSKFGTSTEERASLTDSNPENFEFFFFLENDKFRQKMITDTNFLHL